MSAQFLRCPATMSVSQLAAHFGVKSRDIWLPFTSFVAARSRETATVDIPRSNPIALRDADTGEVYLHRDDVLMKLCLLDQRGAATLQLAPCGVPPPYELYLRWEKATGTKLVAGDAVIMHYVLTSGQTGTMGSAIPTGVAAAHEKQSVPLTGGRRRKRRRDESDAASSQHTHTSVDASTLAETVREARALSDFFVKAAADLDRRLARELAHATKGSDGAPLRPDGNAAATADGAARQANAVREYAVGKILQCRDLPPLHLLPRTVCTSSSLEVPTGISWSRPDPRVLCRVFRSKACAEQSAASKYCDASQQVAFFFVDDVLTAGDFSTLAVEPRQEGKILSASDQVTSAEDEALRARRQKAFTTLGQYAKRSFRIVLLDHFPDLHHGSALAAEQKLAPLARLIEGECCAVSESVTVALSVMSYITAGQKGGSGASFLLPNTGLLRFFTSELNASLAIDTQRSVVVGTRRRRAPYLDDIHSTFAANAGVHFVEVDDVSLL